MNVIIGAFIGLLVVVSVITIGPVLGGKLEATMPALDPTSDFNATHNTNLPSGASVWQDNVMIGSIVVLIFFVMLSLFFIRMIGW